MTFKTCLCAIIYFFIFFHESQSNDVNHAIKSPSILITILVRNKAHTLPYFLSQLSQLSYPKQRISLFIRSDHNEDQSIQILQKWLSSNEKYYHSVNSILKKESPTKFPDEDQLTDWTIDRFNHVIELKEESLLLAKQMWADYIWFLDADVILTEFDIINIMLEKDKILVAPMLNSLGTYSNYWCGMSEDFWYQRTDEYLPILERKEKGCFSVPMIHSSVFINLNIKSSDKLSFNSNNVTGYTGPIDDIITFAISSKTLDIEMFVCNDRIYGFIPPPLNDKEDIQKDYLQMTSIRLEIMVEHPPLKVIPILQQFALPIPTKDKLGFEEVYLINLLRRPERRKRMYHNFDELGLDVKFFEAIDGSKLNESYLLNLGIKQLQDYKDPWAQRDMTFGEIGCFLSHYYIWEEIVEKQFKTILLFEDDIRFEPYFREKVNFIMKEVQILNISWDLIYLGRKKLKNSDEPWVEGSEILVHVDYSYWTLCYILSLEGAQKLLQGKPLEKLVPVDEYLPIMFDKHPEEFWSSNFGPRTLKAFSAAPLMVYPTHYTGDQGYISDTEESNIVFEEDLQEVKSDISLIQNEMKFAKDEL